MSVWEREWTVPAGFFAKGGLTHAELGRLMTLRPFEWIPMGHPFSIVPIMNEGSDFSYVAGMVSEDA